MCHEHQNANSTNLFPQKGELRSGSAEPASNRWPAGRNRRVPAAAAWTPGAAWAPQLLPATSGRPHPPAATHPLLAQASASRRPEVPPPPSRSRFRSAPRASARNRKPWEARASSRGVVTRAGTLARSPRAPRWFPVYLSTRAPKLSRRRRVAGATVMRFTCLPAKPRPKSVSSGTSPTKWGQIINTTRMRPWGLGTLFRNHTVVQASAEPRLVVSFHRESPGGLMGGTEPASKELQARAAQNIGLERP